MRDLGPAIGAEVEGVDLAAAGDPEITSILRGAVAERTLLLRGQEKLTPAGYVGFARRFGDGLDLHSRRDLCHRDHHEIFVVGNVVENGRAAGAAKVGLNWHTDHYHLEHPALFTFLHAILVPPVAGETRYANAIAAWEALDEPNSARITGLTVRHSRGRLYRELFPDATEQQVAEQGQAQAAARGSAEQEPASDDTAGKVVTGLQQVDHRQEQTGDRPQPRKPFQAAVGDTVDAQLLVGAHQWEDEGDGRHQGEGDDVEDFLMGDPPAVKGQRRVQSEEHHHGIADAQGQAQAAERADSGAQAIGYGRW